MEVRPAIVYRGAREICSAVGINWKSICFYVKHKGLPAFKIDGKGTWIALEDDLLQWVQSQRDENFKKYG